MPAKKKKVVRPVAKTSGSLFARYPVFFILLVFLLGFSTHILVTVIFATPNDDVIYACANKRSGELRVITNVKDFREGRQEKERRENKLDKNGCRENEMALEWNKQGPAGPTGQSGSGAGGGGNSFPFTCPACDINDKAGDRLSGKDLSNAILFEVQMNNTNLSNSNLTQANLESSNLDGANFSNTNLERANLKNARTTNTNFTGATWKNTTCPDGTNSDANNNTCDGHFLASEE